MYVKDNKNNVYQLEYRVGELYFLTPVNKNQIDSLFVK